MSPPVFTLDQVIAQLRTSWGGASENNTYPFATSPILYAILTSPPADSSPENAGWVAMSALMTARAAEVFELWDDLIPVIKKYPNLLGIGLSEGTAIIVNGDRFEVMGMWKVAIHDNTRVYQPWEKTYYVLSAGDVYNMKTRKIEKYGIGARAPAPQRPAAEEAQPKRDPGK